MDPVYCSTYKLIPGFLFTGSVEEVKAEKYDIVVFGASGFTGQFVVEELARTIDDEHLKWAIAGRNMKKLQAVLANASEHTGES